jgi:hypothetical protein
MRPVPMQSRQTIHLPSSGGSADHQVQPAPEQTGQRSFSAILRSVIPIQQVYSVGLVGRTCWWVFWVGEAKAIARNKGRCRRSQSRDRLESGRLLVRQPQATELGEARE